MKKLKLILWSLYYRFYLAPFSYLRLCLNGKQRESLRTLCELKDKYKGKRCFVLGNGPSLSKEDVEKLICFTGIDYLTAVSIAVEVGDFSRFSNAKSFQWKYFKFK